MFIYFFATRNHRSYVNLFLDRKIIKIPGERALNREGNKIRKTSTKNKDEK